MSLMITAIQLALRGSFKMPSRYHLPVPMIRQGMEAATKLFRLNLKSNTQHIDLEGVRCLVVSPPEPTEKVILHFHGGVFIAGSSLTHKAFASEMAMRAQAQVVLPDYRLAPEHPYPAAQEDAYTVFQALKKLGHKPKNITVSGDSAGGWLALNLALDLAKKKQPQPSKLILMSPFLDMTMGSESMKQKCHSDPMLTLEMLDRGAGAFFKDMDRHSPECSPLFNQFTKLPPCLIQVGSEEVLLDDSTSLHQKCEAQGFDSTLSVYQGMWHDFQLFHGLVAQADAAIDEMVTFING